jgi:peptidoglycan/LPS O-acetylase OafA/YrhL
MHMPVLTAVKKLTQDPALVLILTLAAVLPLAWMSYRYFEEPIRRLGRHARLVNRPFGQLLPKRA